MSENEVPAKLETFEETIDMLQTQLKWILTECDKNHIQPDTNVGNEMVQRFFSLYGDFQRIFLETVELIEEIKSMEFDDEIMKSVYELHARTLLNRLYHQDFQNFVSVAETGELPEEA